MAFGNASKGYVKAHSSGGGSGGTSDYSQLTNKPSINGVTLSGNKTSADLDISGITLTDVTTDIIDSTVGIDISAINGLILCVRDTSANIYSMIISAADLNNNQSFVIMMYNAYANIVVHKSDNTVYLAKDASSSFDPYKVYTF